MAIEQAFATTVGGAKRGGVEPPAASMVSGPTEAERLVDERTARARVAAAAVTRAEAELVDAVAEVIALEAELGCTPRAWLAWQLGLTPAEASRLCRLAERLPGLSRIEALWRQGAISGGVADVLVRVATPENEAAVVDTAKVATGGQLQTLLRDYRRAKPATRRDPDPATTASQASWWWNDHGRLRVRGDLTADDGATFEAAVEAARARDVPVDPEGVADGELRPEERARLTDAEALMAVAHGSLAGRADDDGLLPEATQVQVHVTDEGASVPDAGTIAPEILARLVCTSTLMAVQLVGGRPVEMTSRRRFFSAHQRRALRVRDRTCRFPGCGRRRHLHAHHNHEFSRRGITDIDDAVLLCPAHHTLVHKRGYRFLLGPDGVVSLIRRDGTRLTGRPPPAPPPPPAAQPPPADRRIVATHEPLTALARDATLAAWLE